MSTFELMLVAEEHAVDEGVLDHLSKGLIVQSHPLSQGVKSLRLSFGVKVVQYLVAEVLYARATLQIFSLGRHI